MTALLMFMNDLCSRKSMRLLCVEPLVTEKCSEI